MSLIELTGLLRADQTKRAVKLLATFLELKAYPNMSGINQIVTANKALANSS